MSLFRTLPYIVDEYIDVTLDEMLGMSLDREVELGIDLFWETLSIFTPSYRMAPTKLVELQR